jgi:hypothetical protein
MLIYLNSLVKKWYKLVKKSYKLMRKNCYQTGLFWSYISSKIPIMITAKIISKGLIVENSLIYEAKIIYVFVIETQSNLGQLYHISLPSQYLILQGYKIRQL